MTLLQSLWATGQEMTPNGDCAGDEVVQLFEFPMPDTTLQVGDVIELAVLPATHVPTDCILVSDQIDTGGKIAFDVGVMSGPVGAEDAGRTVGKELFSAQVVATDPARTNLVSAFTITPTENHRSIGAKVTTAPTTQVPGAKLRLLMKYAPA